MSSSDLGHTECSSCLTSRTVPSLKVHFTMSVSGETPLTNSLLDSLVQNFEKSSSLTRCQTWEIGASMTVDSTTEADVGMLEDILNYGLDSEFLNIPSLKSQAESVMV